MIFLEYNYGFKWYKKDDMYIKGYLFDDNDVLYKEDKLINYFVEVNSKKEFENKLLKANGFFAVIMEKNDKIFCAVDRTRTFPLFYAQKDNNLYISDSVEKLSNKIGKKFIELNEKEFLTTGYVTGNETLLENIYQLEAGNYLVYDKNKKELIIKEYFNYVTNHVKKDSFEKLETEFLNILEKVAKRLIRFADGRQIVVPLSGGYDSRLIVSLLKKYEYDNVFCFTYGKKDSFEVDISKKVAQKLDYKWHFVEYNEKNIECDFGKKDYFKNYIDYSFNFVSSSHIQDFFAVKYLKENNLIEKDAVFVPGHTGDFTSGGHILNCDYEDNKKQIISDIIKKHYNLNFEINANIFKEKIKKNIDYKGFGYSIYENWELKERQSKFIINANRVYGYFGYKHSLPLWDKEMIEFFKVLPLEHKKGQIFYEKVIFSYFFKNYEIDFHKNRKTLVISKIKRFIPLSIKKIYKKVINKKFDLNNFSYIIFCMTGKAMFENINFQIAKYIIGKYKNV